jgi:uncharacterized membrane protein
LRVANGCRQPKAKVPYSVDAMGALSSLLLGSLSLRPYVFGFLGIYLAVAVAEWGWRRALGFTALAGGLAFLAEWTSTRVGVPFGIYHYTGATAGREVYLDNVPLFDPLSFPFLAYSSLGLARGILRRVGSGSPLVASLTTGGLMMALDLVIDPLAVRGDRWFLGRIFYYPEPGRYFGVPLANFAGWAALGTVIAAAWILVVEPRLGSPPDRRGARGRSPALPSLVLYYAILAFNLTLTALVAEPRLFWTGVLLHLPLGAVVLWALYPRPRTAEETLAVGPA